MPIWPVRSQAISSSDECRTGVLRDTAEILCRWLPKRLLEHGDEGRDGFVAEIGRNLLHARARGQLSHCDDQVQLLAPAPEGQPCLLYHETCQTALAERNAIGLFCQGAAVGRMFRQRCGDPPQARLGRDRQMQLLDRHTRQLGEQNRRQELAPGVIVRHPARSGGRRPATRRARPPWTPAMHRPLIGAATPVSYTHLTLPTILRV